MSSSATPPPAAAPAVAAPGAPAAGVAGWLARPLTRVVSSKAAAKALDALGLQTVEDLLRHFPRRYDQPGRFTDLGGLQVGEHVTVLARVQDSGLVPMRSRPGFRLTAIVTDATGRPLDLTFFFRQRHIADYTLRQLEPGRQGLFTGTVGVYGGRLQLTHPDKLMFGEKTDAEAAVLDATKPIPIYQASAKLPSWKIGQTIRLVLGMMPPGLPDPLPPALLADPPAGLWLPGDTAVAGPLPGLAEALTQIHAPASEADWLRARARFRLEEAFVLQAALARRRAATQGLAAAARPGRPGGALAAFDAHLPFRLTGAQAKVGDQLAQDLAATHPMQRLLQGDVGSGKTVVALRAMLQVVDSGGQAALLVPTEVLAGQHYRSIRQLLGPLAARDLVEQAQEDFADDAGAPDGAAVTTPEGRSEKDQPSGIGHGETEVSDDIGRGADGTRPVTVTLLTGSLGTAQKREALAAARDGRADIVIGTHALLSDPVAFRGLGLVVVDEQHRFGVEQRDVLRTRGSVPPHMLVMTATPIPRSLAMTVFGDLEVSVLDELPPGRCPVQTTVVPASKPAWVARVWERLAEEARDGHQAFVVCPRIAEGPGDQGAGEDGFWAAEDEAAGADGPKPPLASVESTLRLFEDNPALKDLRVAPLHGQMSAEDKARTMAAFQAGQLDALVATTVIEVGIDVPKATAMVILDADRFGLAQLHQMRGRVGRGGLPGLCLLLSGAEPGTPAAERLAAMERTSDGFELSEVDLRLRREGDVLGAAQTGRGGLKLLRVMRDRELIAQARELATRLVAADPGLARPEHAELRRVLDGRLADREEYLERT